MGLAKVEGDGGIVGHGGMLKDGSRGRFDSALESSPQSCANC